jgi:hypothetical protein
MSSGGSTDARGQTVMGSERWRRRPQPAPGERFQLGERSGAVVLPGRARWEGFRSGPAADTTVKLAGLEAVPFATALLDALRRNHPVRRLARDSPGLSPESCEVRDGYTSRDARGNRRARAQRPIRRACGCFWPSRVAACPRVPPLAIPRNEGVGGSSPPVGLASDLVASPRVSRTIRCSRSRASLAKDALLVRRPVRQPALAATRCVSSCASVRRRARRQTSR